MEISSDESSYTVESVASFDSQVWEHFTCPSLCFLLLGVYREQLLPEDSRENRNDS